MIVPVISENCLRQPFSRHWNLPRLAIVPTLTDPHFGQHGPSGHLMEAMYAVARSVL